MKPYYQDEWVTIYQRDCRGIIGQIEADVCITDPIWPNAPIKYYPWGGFNPQEVFAGAMAQLEVKRLVIVMRSDSDPRFLQVVPDRYPFFRTQNLPYVMPGYIGRKLGGDEIAYCFGDPIPSAPGRRVIPGYSPKAQPNHRPANGHPMSRALTHFKWLIDWWSLPGETVIDPFMGSGVTIRAARAAGRKSIGIEINEEYCARAVELLNKPEMILAEQIR